MHINRTTRNFQFCREPISLLKCYFNLHFSVVFVFVIKYSRLCAGVTNLVQKKKYHLFFRENIPRNTTYSIKKRPLDTNNYVLCLNMLYFSVFFGRKPSSVA